MPSKYTEHDSGIFTSRTFKLDGEPLSGGDAEQWERTREHMAVSLFDRVEADARHVLGADGATPEARADAERLLSLIVQMRCIIAAESKVAELREKFSEHTGVRAPGGAPAMQSGAAVAYAIGALHSQLCVRHMEGAAKIGKEIAMQWRGVWLTATILERSILELFADADEVGLHTVVRHCWGDTYDDTAVGSQRDAALRKLRKTIHGVNGKLLNADAAFALAVHGDHIIVR